MPTFEHHKVAIIGAGQGGLGVSYHLCKAKVPHVVLDRGTIASAWKVNRWDSFCLVTPNWTVNLPGKSYDGDDPDGFMLRDEFVDYLTDWADSFGVPIRSGVNVTKVTGVNRRFLLETNECSITADNVVVATATYQHPKVPQVAEKIPPHIRQMHAETTRTNHRQMTVVFLLSGPGKLAAR